MFNLPIKKIPFTKVIKIGTAFFKKNSADILTATAVGGVVFTGVMVYRGTLNAEKYINGMIDENASDDTRKVVRVKSLKYYIPAAISAAGTIACIVGANAINHKRIAGLAAACALAETTLQENRDKIKELIGEKELQKLDGSVGGEHIDKTDAFYDDPENHPGQTLFVEGYLTGAAWWSDMNSVKRGINDYNEVVNLDTYADWNVLLNNWGLREVQIASNIGHNVHVNGVARFEFIPQIDPMSGQTYTVVMPRNYPVSNFMDIL